MAMVVMWKRLKCQEGYLLEMVGTLQPGRLEERWCTENGHFGVELRRPDKILLWAILKMDLKWQDILRISKKLQRDGQHECLGEALGILALSNALTL